jgi:hypothetical protein
MTPEGRVRSRLRKRALELGYEHRKLRWIGRAGAPDELLFWSESPTGQPFTVLVEVKREEGILPKPHQQREIDRLRQAGFIVYVVGSVEEVEAMFSELGQR